MTKQRRVRMWAVLRDGEPFLVQSVKKNALSDASEYRLLQSYSEYRWDVRPVTVILPPTKQKRSKRRG